MRRLLICCCLWLCWSTATLAEPTGQLNPPPQSPAWLYEPFLAHLLGLRPRESEVDVEKKVALTTPDHQHLLADLYHPRGHLPAPTILVRIPLDDNDKGRLFSEMLGQLWASRGYNVMIQGVRGRFGSSGEHVPFQHETADGIASLRWLQQQPWHNGHTGMWGGSYFGYTQWALAEQTDLGLEALFIQIASTDHWRTFHPGGALAYETALFWATRSYSSVDTPLSHDRLQQAMQSGPVLTADQRAVGQSIPFYRDWVRHTRRDAFWQRADGRQRAQKLQVPSLLMAGWYDPFLPSQLADFKRIQASASPRIAYTSHLIIGPWSHAETMTLPDGYQDLHYRLASLKPALDWYDQHLLGRALHAFAPVRLFVSGINCWRAEQEWPLRRARITPLYLSRQGPANSLNGRGQLNWEPVQHLAQDHYWHDPADPVPSQGGAILLAERSGPWLQNEVEKRQDVLVYTSGILSDNLEVTGELRARLTVSSSAPNTDFVVKLVDVFPDGRAYGMSQGILRQTSAPGRRRQITVELWPVGHVFLKGHRLRVEVASSHFPMFDVNPGFSPPHRAQQSLYTGPGQSSQILLPVIPPGSEPPCSQNGQTTVSEPAVQN